MKPLPPHLVSVSEAARLLGVSRITIYRWIAAGFGPPRVMHGRRPAIERAAIDRFLTGGDAAKTPK
jgi:excisionase family DNA binding protein